MYALDTCTLHAYKIYYNIVVVSVFRLKTGCETLEIILQFNKKNIRKF